MTFVVQSEGQTTSFFSSSGGSMTSWPVSWPQACASSLTNRFVLSPSPFPLSHLSLILHLCMCLISDLSGSGSCRPGSREFHVGDDSREDRSGWLHRYRLFSGRSSSADVQEPRHALQGQRHFDAISWRHLVNDNVTAFLCLDVCVGNVLRAQSPWGCSSEQRRGPNNQYLRQDGLLCSVWVILRQRDVRLL